MLLLERDGNICRGSACGQPFTSLDEIRVDEIDGSEHHNCLRNKQLLHHSCNISKGLRQKAMRLQNPDFDTTWLRSSYPSSRQADRVCVPKVAEGYEVIEIRTGISEGFRVQKKESRVEPVRVHSIIPRDKSGIDDGLEDDTPSQTANKRNQPRYFLYFMLKVKLGYQFRATEAKRKFAQTLGIAHGTIKNHYYPTMSEYFDRDVQGNFIDVRKEDARPYIEETEIENLIAAYRRGTINEHAFLLDLYQETLGIKYDELLQLFADAPVLNEPVDSAPRRLGSLS